MSEEWVEGYRETILRYVLLRGSVRQPHDTVYMWRRTDRQAEIQKEHLQSCGLNAPECSLTEDVTWYEFEDSFTDCSSHYGIDALLSCACGTLRGVPFRLEETLGEVMRGLLGGS